MRSLRASTVSSKSTHQGRKAGFRVRLKGGCGQATVEYALVVFALLAIVVACAVLWHALDEGLFVSHAAAGASHHVGRGSTGAAADVLLY